jgi:cyclopropane fatty-acyl-phospholipid synthase-like methyltransferase
MKRLTSKNYWENYYHKSIVSLDNLKIGRTYDAYWDLIFESDVKNVIEIGAFPGRYLTYVADKYKVEPTAFDFQTDLGIINEYFKLCNIEKYNVISADFFEYSFEKKYDLVMSIGFVEHFENFNKVLSMQCELVNEGGFIFIQVPNKRYLRYFFGILADSENLKAHNLKVMDKRVFKNVLDEMGFEILALDYTGPFQFTLHNDNGKKNFRFLIYKIFRLIFKTFGLNKIVEKFPSKFWSASIVVVGRKKFS